MPWIIKESRICELGQQLDQYVFELRNRYKLTAELVQLGGKLHGPRIMVEV